MVGYNEGMDNSQHTWSVTTSQMIQVGDKYIFMSGNIVSIHNDPAHGSCVLKLINGDDVKASGTAEDFVRKLGFKI